MEKLAILDVETLAGFIRSLTVRLSVCLLDIPVFFFIPNNIS